MSLSPEERRRIYEEEKERIEAEQKLQKKAQERNIGTFKTTRNERLTASVFAIICLLGLLVFFNFFNEYIAYYHLEHAGNPDIWAREPILTSSFSTWLVVLNVTLALSIIGNIGMIIFDRYLMREAILIVLYALGTWTIAAFISIFPLTFNNIASSVLSDNLPIIIKGPLVVFAFVLGMAALVRAIRLIITAILRWRNANQI